ncbi:MAG: ATP-binding cassette domain-containing protein [bacterium]|jgi:ABC-2 type transport system ATP-binding protein
MPPHAGTAPQTFGPMIRAERLTRRFGAITALDGLNLEVRRGEIFGLVGPDGAGKTTALRLMAGLLAPSEGRVSVAGYDVRSHPDAVKDRIGYMSQRFGRYLDLTVRENMVFCADLFGVPLAARDALMARLLRMTRMEPFLDRQAGKLSGGMKQKLALMCTLLHRPEVLFLDEPTNGVDPVSRRDFWAILYQLVNDGLTVLITTAYLDEAERCNRVGLMNRGRLIRQDSPEALRNSLGEHCFEVRARDRRVARELLAACAGVSSAEPAGDALHVFINPVRTTPEELSAALGGAEFRRITPSLEDVFIALIRKAEAA